MQKFRNANFGLFTLPRGLLRRDTPSLPPLLVFGNVTLLKVEQWIHDSRTGLYSSGGWIHLKYRF